MSTHGEDALVAWLRRAMPGGHLLGDDTAVLEPASWAVTVDTQIAGVHVPEDLDPARFARRLLAVNLSDLAASGARPAFAFLALSAPSGFDHRRFFRAFGRAASAHGVALAGGDLSCQPRLTAALTLLGRRWPDGRWLNRREARAGDVVWVGGTLGESALGLALLGAGVRLDDRAIRVPPGFAPVATRRAIRRHLLPTPQIELGRWLACHTARGAAIDLSDGLAKDLHRLCRASGVGARIRLEDLPKPPGFARLAAKLGQDPEALILFGGEDYVLLFTLPKGENPPLRGAVAIGVIESRRRVRLVTPDGPEPLPDRGWDHLEMPTAQTGPAEAGPVGTKGFDPISVRASP